MKTLYIVRHAKSSWDFPDLPDVERPVIEEGIFKTKKIAIELKKRNVSVDLIISSHTKRALETAKMIATGIYFPVEKIEVSKDIYEVGMDDVFDMIFEVNNDVQSLMIVGHNPTFTQIANYFLQEEIDIIPTSGVISIDFETNNWADIKKAKHKINFILFPKMLN
jgi:phosphohistidine phosphatase